MTVQKSDSGVNDVQAILQEVAQQIAAKKDIIAPKGKQSAKTTTGGKLPPEFYEQLEAAEQLHNQIGIKLQIVPSSTPIIGPLLDRIRYNLHELVLFYVNKLAAEQVCFNSYLLQAVRMLAEEVEKDQD